MMNTIHIRYNVRVESESESERSEQFTVHSAHQALTKVLTRLSLRLTSILSWYAVMRSKVVDTVSIGQEKAITHQPTQPTLAPFPLSTSDQAEAAMNLGDDDLRLLCVIEGETEVFPVDIEGPSWRNPKFMVGDLKKKIQEERKYGPLAGVDAHSLVLWKVRATEDERGQTIWLVIFAAKRGGF